MLLRLSIGWHFFAEGISKYAHPEAFSSVAFFAQAKGPLAEWFHAWVPDFHEASRLLARPLAIEPLSDEQRWDREQWQANQSERATKARQEGRMAEVEFPPYAPYTAWAEQIARDWRSMLQRLIEHCHLDEEQRVAAANVLDRRKRQLGDYLAEMSDEIATYRHELDRLERLEADQSTGELPFHDKLVAQKRAETGAMPGVWIHDIQAFENEFRTDLMALLNDDQKMQATAVFETSSTNQIDTAVTYIILLVGVCLLLGLFTRPAALAGALFLLAVIATQPPWVEGAAPVYYQLVEAVALVTLATTAAGRLAGLDFFVHRLLRGCCGRKRETS